MALVKKSNRKINSTSNPGSALCIAEEKARYETLELRDTLLPKMMRGELSVGDAEIIVLEEAGA